MPVPGILKFLKMDGYAEFLRLVRVKVVTVKGLKCVILAECNKDYKTHLVSDNHINTNISNPV